MKEHDLDSYFAAGFTSKTPICNKWFKLWSENGNFLSVQYSGTGINVNLIKIESTSNAIARDQDEGIMGALRGSFKQVNRFLINTFADDFRQQCFDAILCRNDIIRIID